MESTDLPKLSKQEMKKVITASTCILAVLFGGISVWSINGTYTGDVHVVNDLYTDQWTINPIIQGIFASITFVLLFISFYLLMSIQLDALARK